MTRLVNISCTPTSLGIGYSSDSSIRTTWLILGLLSESGSTHLKAVKRALLRALVDGLVSMFGSITSSERLLPTIIFSQSTRLTCKFLIQSNWSSECVFISSNLLFRIMFKVNIFLVVLYSVHTKGINRLPKYNT